VTDAPDWFAAELRQLRNSRDPRLKSALRQARRKGWTLQALGDLIGITGETVRQICAKRTRGPKWEGIVPSPPGRNRRQAPDPPAGFRSPQVALMQRAINYVASSPNPLSAPEVAAGIGITAGRANSLLSIAAKAGQLSHASYGRYTGAAAGEGVPDSLVRRVCDYVGQAGRPVRPAEVAERVGIPADTARTYLARCAAVGLLTRLRKGLYVSAGPLPQRKGNRDLTAGEADALRRLPVADRPAAVRELAVAGVRYRSIGEAIGIAESRVADLVAEARGHRVLGQTLPPDVAERLREMHAAKSAQLSAELHELSVAGWSYAALARALGVSHTAVRNRVSAHAQKGTGPHGLRGGASRGGGAAVQPAR